MSPLQQVGQLSYIFRETILSQSVKGPPMRKYRPAMFYRENNSGQSQAESSMDLLLSNNVP